VREKILETVAALTALLDVEAPFELRVVDPSGISELKPEDGVAVGTYDPNLDA